MADADPQQRNEMMGAIQQYAVNAVIGSCGWHIIAQGWKRRGPSETDVDGETARNCFHTAMRLLPKKTQKPILQVVN